MATKDGGDVLGGSKNAGHIFRQAIPDAGLSLERGTDAVEKDGYFHLILRGKEVLRTRSQQEAIAEYRRLRDALVVPTNTRVDVREALRREAALSEAELFHAQSSREKRARATRKGGKGGSGGVGG